MLENTAALSENSQPDETLRKSEALLRAVFDANTEMLCITNIFGVFVEVNAAFCAATGLEREQILGKTSNDVNLWVDLNRRQEFLEILGQNGSVDCFAADLRDAVGRVHRCLLCAKVLKVGGIPLVLSSAKDMSEVCGGG